MVAVAPFGTKNNELRCEYLSVHNVIGKSRWEALKGKKFSSRYWAAWEQGFLVYVITFFLLITFVNMLLTCLHVHMSTKQQVRATWKPAKSPSSFSLFSAGSSGFCLFLAGPSGSSHIFASFILVYIRAPRGPLGVSYSCISRAFQYSPAGKHCVCVCACVSSCSQPQCVAICE